VIRPAWRFPLLFPAIACGLGAAAVATRDGQLTTYAGASGWALAVELVAGWGLVAAGLGISQLRPEVIAGPLAVAAGFAWFAPDFVGWEGGPAVARSLGMLLAGLWLPLLVHAVLAFPRGLPSFSTRALVAATYAATAVVNLGRALFRDPFEDVNCWSNCTDNSFLIRSEPRIGRTLDWFDLRFAIAFAVAFVALAVWRLLTATGAARRLLAPALAAGAAVAVLHGAHAVALLRTPLEDPRAGTFSALFIGRSLAVAGVAAALAWALVRNSRARRAVQRLAVELVEAARTGALEAALVRVTGDPTLTIAYPLRRDGRYVDSQGRAVPAPAPSGSRAVTPIVRDGHPVALLEHDPAVLGAAFEQQIGSAARLAVENERLQAETLAQLIELRESRARIVRVGDAVRRQLERDLHDGAQQRLVALSFALRLARGRVGPEPEPRVAEPLADAERALFELLDTVRAVAHGLFPITLAASGLAHAVEELAELTPIRIDVETLPGDRLPAPVEAAAYGVIREAIENAARHADARTVSVAASLASDTLVVEAADDGIGGADPARGVGLLDVADRVGALGGRLTIESPVGGGTRIHAEIPCA
jgi:signal transduction histidine kinase